MRRKILFTMLAAASPLLADAAKIHGYVTAVSSQGFEIDDYRVVPAAPVPGLHVGSEVEVAGDVDPPTHEVRASQVHLADDTSNSRRTAIVEQNVLLQRDGSGWTGVLRIDGETVRIDASTRVLLIDRQSNAISPGSLVSYEGERQRDGSLAASRFQVLSSGAGEHNRETAPRLTSGGEIVIHGVHHKLVPDAEAQSYVQRVGSKLVPRVYAQEASEGAAHRLAFQFFLIQDPEFNAQAFPGGTVLINVGVLRALSNEAQLAAVIAHEIAHATQDHGGSAGTSRAKALLHLGKTESSPASYTHESQNQADRVGLEYMIAAGYDPREAANVWKELPHAAGIKASPAWDAGDDALLRRSYLLSEIRAKHPGTDFQAFIRNTPEFDNMAERFGNTAIRHRAAESLMVASVVPGIIGGLPVAPPAVAPAPAPKNNPPTGNFVTITSQPDGAEVWMGSRLVGTTPMNLMTGHVGLPFTITVRKAGYHDWTTQLVTVPGKTSLRVDMYRE